MSKQGNPYGSQYHAVMDGNKPLVDGNIKFVMKNSRDSESLMETMTRGRVYVRFDDSGTLREIVYFDNDNKRVKQIDLSHYHNKTKPHVHHGYESA